MIIGVPRKSNRRKPRGAPAHAIYQLDAGHKCRGNDAGAGSGFPDAEFKAGPRDGGDAWEVFARADMIVRSRTLAAEFGSSAQGQFLSPTCTSPPTGRSRSARQSRATCIAMKVEVIAVCRCWRPMSEIAGRMSVSCGYFLQKHTGGLAGVLLGGVPGVCRAASL